MSHVIKDRIRETSITTGTADFDLGGAVNASYRAFGDVMSTGDTCWYAAVLSGTEWEVGLGTYNSVTNRIARTTVLASSNGGSKVLFSTGTKDLWLDIPSAAILGQSDISALLSATEKGRLRTNIGAYDALVRYDAAQSLTAAQQYQARNNVGVLGVLVPHGRLTLTSGVKVLTSDVTAATSIYYTPYNGNHAPIYDGTEWTWQAFSELTLALDGTSGHTGYHQSGKNFDLYLINDSGTLRLASSPAWASDTSRGTGAGTAEIATVAGVETNANTMTMRFGSSSGNTVSIAANCGTLVGTFRASADGQTQMKFGGASVGGSEAWFGISNLYNDIEAAWTCEYTNDSYPYTTATWRAMGTSNTMRCSMVRCVNRKLVEASHHQLVGGAGSAVGIALDATNTTSSTLGYSGSASSLFVPVYRGLPGLGFHYIQSTEKGVAAATFYGDNGTSDGTITCKQIGRLRY